MRVVRIYCGAAGRVVEIEAEAGAWRLRVCPGCGKPVDVRRFAYEERRGRQAA